MKRYAKSMTLALAAVFLSIACTSAPKFSDVQNKDWDLVEVRTTPKQYDFDRGQLEEEGFDDIFTLRFDAERANGIGAPNRFFAPYTLADKQGITIKTVAATLMAPIHAPEKLKEQEYFMYLQNTGKWNLAGGKLELYSKAEDGSEALMVFVVSGKKR